MPICLRFTETFNQSLSIPAMCPPEQVNLLQWLLAMISLFACLLWGFEKINCVYLLQVVCHHHRQNCNLIVSYHEAALSPTIGVISSPPHSRGLDLCDVTSMIITSLLSLTVLVLS